MRKLLFSIMFASLLMPPFSVVMSADDEILTTEEPTDALNGKLAYLFVVNDDNEALWTAIESGDCSVYKEGLETQVSVVGLWSEEFVLVMVSEREQVADLPDFEQAADLAKRWANAKLSCAGYVLWDGAAEEAKNKLTLSGIASLSGGYDIGYQVPLSLWYLRDVSGCESREEVFFRENPVNDGIWHGVTVTTFGVSPPPPITPLPPRGKVDPSDCVDMPCDGALHFGRGNDAMPPAKTPQSVISDGEYLWGGGD
jgi:hypothetical protein